MYYAYILFWYIIFFVVFLLRNVQLCLPDAKLSPPPLWLANQPKVAWPANQLNLAANLNI